MKRRGTVGRRIGYGFLTLLGLPWTLLAASTPSSTGLVLDGVPEPDPAVELRIRRYLGFRPAGFQGWHPRRRDVLVTILAGPTRQLHEIRIPEGPLLPLTAESDPVAGGSWDPSDRGGWVFWRDTEGDEDFRLFWRGPDAASGAPTGGWPCLPGGICWSHGGRWLGYGRSAAGGEGTELRILDPSDPGAERLVLRTPQPGWSILDWSKDDRSWLVHELRSARRSVLHWVEVGTGARRRVAPGEGEDVFYSEARLLPGDREALVISDRGTEFRHLSVLDLHDGSERRFGPEYPGDVEQMDLSPEARWVAFFVNEKGISRLHLLERATGREHRVPELPAGVASGLRWRPRGREVAFTLDGPRCPGEVLSVDFRTGGVTRWTKPWDGLRRAGFPREPEPVEVQALDGRVLAGLIHRPDPARFPGRRPVLLRLHGGPEGQARPVFQGRWNALVGEWGVAVVDPNVRGSTGFGKTFMGLDDGVRREDAVRDVGAFLDWVGKDPGLDPARVAVHGTSYGGFLALASLAQFGERLRCGVDVLGITSLPDFLRRTRMDRRNQRREEYGDERDPVMEAFLSRISPMARLDRIRQPLLVVHGAQDPRVPILEAETLVRELRARGGSVGLLRAEDEGHGFARSGNGDFQFQCVVEFLRQHLGLDAEAVP